MELDKDQIEALGKFKKQAEDALATYREPLAIAAEQAMQIAEQARQIFENPDFKAFLDTIARTQKALADYFERNQDVFQKIAQTAELIHDHQVLCDTITENGWPISPSFPLRDIIDSKVAEPAKIDSYVITHFENDDYESLNALFAKAKSNTSPSRAMILDEVLNCYKLGNYHACTCLALTQLEGISLDFLIEASSQDPKLKQELTKKRIISKGPTRNRSGKVETALNLSLENWIETGMLDYIALGNTLDLINNKLFGKCKPTGIQLHAANILHGFSSTYGTKKNALIAILLIDLITTLKLDAEAQTPT